jgi:hypothetical protein
MSLLDMSADGFVRHCGHREEIGEDAGDVERRVECSRNVAKLRSIDLAGCL